MEWITIYDITQHDFLLVDIIIAAFCIVLGVWVLAEIGSIKEGEDKLSFQNVAKIGIQCIIIIVGILSIKYNWVNFNSASFSFYEQEYKSGNYAVIEGQPYSQLMGNGGFMFSVGEMNFICDDNFDQKRKKEIDPYVKNEEQSLKVYYYDDKMFDVPNQQYMVVRIDALVEIQD